MLNNKAWIKLPLQSVDWPTDALTQIESCAEIHIRFEIHQGLAGKRASVFDALTAIAHELKASDISCTGVLLDKTQVVLRISASGPFQNPALSVEQALTTSLRVLHTPPASLEPTN